MALGPLKKLAQFLGAKSVEMILPHISKHPQLLGKLFDKVRDMALDQMREKTKLPPAKKEKKLRSLDMVFQTMKRKLPELAPNVQRKIVFNLWYLQVTRSEEIRDRFLAEHGVYPPHLIAFSPSMRCNLRCKGCYAAEHDTTDELTYEEVSEVVRQGKEDLGTRFYVVLGGEPTIWPHLERLLRDHDDVCFHIYTHGQTLTKEFAEMLADCGNCFLALSIEGGPNETNFRRGPGSYDRIVKGMELLRDAGCLYGFSATHTSLNHEVIANQAFFKDMLDRGCVFGWVFQYIPIGRDPSMDLMPTAEQRYERIVAIEDFREKNPLLIFDFWNDGEMTDGCMAYGRRYFHVTSIGQVEPCVFVQVTRPEFNVRKMKLKDVLLSKPYVAARKQAPFTGDNIAPCSLIDNTEFLPEFIKEHGMIASAPGTEAIMSPEFREELHRRSMKYRELMAAREAADAANVGAEVSE